MIRFLSGILDRIFVVLGAVLFAQGPHFIQHYIQRLGGHVSELRSQMNQIQASASASGKTLQAYIEKFLYHPDVDFALQGEFLQTIHHRFEELSFSYQSLIQATPLSRPFLFITHVNPGIAKETFHDFSFGFSLTAESLLYAAIGMGVGYLFFQGISRSIGFLLKRFEGVTVHATHYVNSFIKKARQITGLCFFV